MTQLVRYETARNALAAAHSYDEVKDIRDKTAAMVAYARQAGDNEMLKWATEIKVRAERRAGEMLAESKANGERHGQGGNQAKSPDATLPPTLADIGISKSQSSRWQKLAAVPEEQFEQAVSAALEIAGEVNLGVVVQRAHVANNSGNNEWYTPARHIELARAVMGGIDTDPASSEIANRTVKAAQFFTADDDGRSKTWKGRVWMNPPYAQPLMNDFAEAVASKFEAGEIEQACILVNNATETQWFQRILAPAAAVCFPKSRIKFIDLAGNPSGAPLQGQAIVYMGENVQAFVEAFGEEGAVLRND